MQHAGPRSYEFSLDDKIVHGGKQSLRVDNIGRAPHGMVFQDLPVGELRGRTLRLSAYVRTRDVTGSRYGGGAMVTGSGSVWLDDFALEALPAAP